MWCGTRVCGPWSVTSVFDKIQHVCLARRTAWCVADGGETSETERVRASCSAGCLTRRHTPPRRLNHTTAYAYSATSQRFKPKGGALIRHFRQVHIGHRNLCLDLFGSEKRNARFMYVLRETRIHVQIWQPPTRRPCGVVPHVCTCMHIYVLCMRTCM